MELSPMRKVFDMTWCKFVDRYAPYLDVDDAEKLRDVSFRDLYAGYHAYYQQLKAHVAARDHPFLLALASKVMSTNMERVWHDELTEQDREKLWDFLKWFDRWFTEFTAPFEGQ